MKNNISSTTSKNPPIRPISRFSAGDQVGMFSILRYLYKDEAHGNLFLVSCIHCGKRQNQWERGLQKNLCVCQRAPGGRKSTIFLTVDGMTKTVQEWATFLGDPSKAAGIRTRLHKRKLGNPMTDRQIVYGIRTANIGEMSPQQAGMVVANERTINNATARILSAIEPVINELIAELVRKVSAEAVAVRSAQERADDLNGQPQSFKTDLHASLSSAVPALSAHPSDRPDQNLCLPEGVEEEDLDGYTKSFVYWRNWPDTVAAEKEWSEAVEAFEWAQAQEPPKPPQPPAKPQKPTHPYLQGVHHATERFMYLPEVQAIVAPVDPRINEDWPPLESSEFRDEWVEYETRPWVSYYHSGNLHPDEGYIPDASGEKVWVYRMAGRGTLRGEPLHTMDDFEVFRRYICTDPARCKGAPHEDYWITHCLYNREWVNHRQIFCHRTFNDHMEVFYMALMFAYSIPSHYFKSHRKMFESLVERCLELNVDPRDVAQLLPGNHDHADGRQPEKDSRGSPILLSPFLPPDDPRRFVSTRVRTLEFLTDLIGNRQVPEPLYKPKTTDRRELFPDAPVFYCGELIGE